MAADVIIGARVPGSFPLGTRRAVRVGVLQPRIPDGPKPLLARFRLGAAKVQGVGGTRLQRVRERLAEGLALCHQAQADRLQFRPRREEHMAPRPLLARGLGNVGRVRGKPVDVGDGHQLAVLVGAHLGSGTQQSKLLASIAPTARAELFVENRQPGADVGLGRARTDVAARDLHPVELTVRGYRSACLVGDQRQQRSRQRCRHARWIDRLQRRCGGHRRCLP